MRPEHPKVGRVLKEIYLDTNVIIDLIALDCLIEVLGVPSAVFHATENVLAEIVSLLTLFGRLLLT